MTRLLTLAAVAFAVVVLLPLLPLLTPVRPQPVAAIPSPLTGQTVASLRAIARRRGVRTIAGVPVASCRRAALLAALA